ncbi:MAG TPA: hypothetical protein PLZ36_00165 [Armatimonadota bacterium]|nr:hypothetical protein [Armatimonadota bacterium]
MRRLLWKELRERGWWGLAWAAAILGVALFAHGQAFVGDRAEMALPWYLLPLTLALLTGAGGYASDTAHGRAGFLCARPVSPWQILGGKLLFGALVAFGVPLLAAAIFYGTCDAVYRPFVTLPHVLAGVGDIGGKMGACYLLGLASSLVVPGVLGSLLTLSSVFIVAFAAAILSQLYLSAHQFAYIHPFAPTSSAVDPQAAFTHEARALALLVAVALGGVIAVIAAAAPLARVGLTLDTGERIKRFVGAFLPIYAGLWLAGALLPVRWLAPALLRTEMTVAAVSPSGQYAFVVHQRRFNPLGTANDLSADTFGSWGTVVALDSASVVAPVPAYGGDPREIFYHWWWAPDDTAFYHQPYDTAVRMFDPHHRQWRERVIDRGFHLFTARLSPDGRYLLTRLLQGGERMRMHLHPGHSLAAFDLRADRRFRPIQVGAGPPGFAVALGDYWWQTADTIGYTEVYRGMRRARHVKVETLVK